MLMIQWQFFLLILGLLLILVCQIKSIDSINITYIGYECANISNNTLFNIDEGNEVIDQIFQSSNLSVRAWSVKSYDFRVDEVPNHQLNASSEQCRLNFRLDICQACVDDAVHKIFQDDCPFYNEAMVLYCKCVFQFASCYISNATGISPTPPMSSPTSLSDDALTLSEACVAAFGLVFLISGLWICIFHERRGESFQKLSIARSDSQLGGSIRDVNNLESFQFNFKEIIASTSNFSWENKLGEGGYGEVYKGILSSGEEIAVKRLSKTSKQGGNEFKNEVLLLEKLQHKNLVKLIGYCISEDEKILIFEFLPNLSLDRFLYDSQRRAQLDWEQRYKIIKGVARGLMYLHEDSRLKIIHRDLKASNILLDETMNAKISDFGLAKLFDSDQTQDITTKIAGTYGYMAPEYVLVGHFSTKSDVYSFGVIVLEIVSGQKNRFFQQEEDEGLLHRAWRLWNEDGILELVDPLMGDIFSEEEVKLCIQMGILCIQEDATHRPTITSIVASLNGQSINLPRPNAPHFFTVSDDVSSEATSSNYNLVPKNKLRHKKLDSISAEHTGTRNITELCPR